MKTLSLLAVLAVAGFLLLVGAGKWTTEAKRETQIREHKVTLAMPAEAVRRAIGAPMQRYTDRAQHEYWVYADRVVEIGGVNGGYVLDQTFGPRVASGTPYPDRIWSQLSDGTWVNHRSDVSAMQSVGGGGGYVGMPQSSGKARTGNPLNQPAHR